ncbi:MAG: chromate transporter [Candidatus Rokuibacteriota bacterium]
MPFRVAELFWIKLGFINFGGPTGQIAIMHQELVERRRWISNGRFLHALNYCMLLPGPEAQQLAIYVGWLLHKVKGGIVAGVAFVLPALFLILGLSYTFVTYGDVEWVGAIFYGLRAAVIGLVAAAVIRIGQKALRNPAMYLVAGAAFVAIFLVHVPFPLIVLAAGLLGLVAGPIWPGTFALPTAHGPQEGEGPAISDDGSAGDHTVAERLRCGRWFKNQPAPPLRAGQAHFFERSCSLVFPLVPTLVPVQPGARGLVQSPSARMERAHVAGRESRRRPSLQARLCGLGPSMSCPALGRGY